MRSLYSCPWQANQENWAIDVDPIVEGDIARGLDDAEIPYCFFGNPVLRMYGHRPERTFRFGESRCNEGFQLWPEQFSGWVVADLHLEQVVPVLQGLAFGVCSQHTDCTPMEYSLGGQPLPDLHFHPEGVGYPGPSDLVPIVTISFYASDNVFWDLLDPPFTDPLPNDPNYMLSNDEFLPECSPAAPYLEVGRRSPSQYPLKIPTPARYTEIAILNLCRAVHGNAAWKLFWEGQLRRIVEVMDNDPDENPVFELDDLPSPFREYLSCQWTGTVEGLVEASVILQKLYEELVSEDSLPDATGTWAKQEMHPDPPGFHDTLADS
ncbi:hypothetical protein BO70DRAFT_360029 [Aspergillus heteromorphus CBS 117.55]|uniref:Uncharacterized protein n=1 Tax=Aspergillus heteromorphus CBS 117.55 TaxID=1448321 RepID=A0A317WM16_9EURO|nr:uncharacterized protein BO70DRAFT_360029 [Aspergillus heteromorphus CBS 117.55]PWY87389.1 hypothetical protein BO70DRAFT_360029 [Aspergillus heteromorphus CBS 117.55]